MKIKIDDMLIEVTEKDTYFDALARLNRLEGALGVMVRGETLSLNEKVREADTHILTYLMKRESAYTKGPSALCF